MDFYIQASKVLAKLDAKTGSIKGLTLQSGEKNGARLYALVLETLKYRDILTQVIKKSDLLIKERKLAAQGQLALLLVHDLLLKKAGIESNAGPFKDAVLRHKTRLKAEWTKAKIKLKISDNASLAKVNSNFIPRWARINTIRTTKTEILRGFPGFEVVRELSLLNKDCIYEDEHIDNLIAFHPQQSLTDHPYYLDGSIILQNKASCIPAAILDPPPHAVVIDACAAPGNKTTHLAALLRSTGKLYAFERDSRRASVLRGMLDKAGANVEVFNQDFTRTDPHDSKFALVTHLLLDPSCSGSGIVGRLDYLTSGPESTIENEVNDSAKDQGRLESLSSFQLALLLHAMKFPKAEKITYSTCSVHAIENEGVVMEALRKSPDWRLSTRDETLPTWPLRGKVEECHGNERTAAGLIRAEPGELGTIGFFVACFVKISRTNQPKREYDLFLADTSDSEPRAGSSGFRGRVPGTSTDFRPQIERPNCTTIAPKRKKRKKRKKVE